jgi:hypothetical protein
VIVLFALQQSHLGLFGGLLALGLVIGVFGHLARSRALIVTGILMIGLVSAYFSLAPQSWSR